MFKLGSATSRVRHSGRRYRRRARQASLAELDIRRPQLRVAAVGRRLLPSCSETFEKGRKGFEAMLQALAVIEAVTPMISRPPCRLCFKRRETRDFAARAAMAAMASGSTPIGRRRREEPDRRPRTRPSGKISPLHANRGVMKAVRFSEFWNFHKVDKPEACS